MWNKKTQSTIQLNSSKKARFAKRALAAAAAASVAATAVVSYQGVPQTQPMKSYAKESFGGIKQIVQEHGEGEPYVILDIVPGEGVYTDAGNDYKISIGTLGYLVRGQAPIEKDLETIFTENQEAFYEYDARINLADAVMPDFANSTFIKAVYEEAYEGTEEDLSRSNGWIKILDPVEDVDSVSGNVPKGQMLAKWQKWKEGESKTGYDYKLADGSPVPAGDSDSMTVDTVYQPDENGIYQVTFENPQEGTNGYQVADVNEDWKNATDATSVYRLVDGKYYYAGTVKELKLQLGIYSEEDVKEEEPKEENKPEDKKPDTPPTEEAGEDTAGGDDNNDAQDSSNTGEDDKADDVQSGSDGSAGGTNSGGNTENSDSNHSTDDTNKENAGKTDDAADEESGLTISAATPVRSVFKSKWYKLVETGEQGDTNTGSGDSGSGGSGSGNGSGGSGSGGSGSSDSGSGSGNSGSGSGSSDSGSGSGDSGSGDSGSGSGGSGSSDSGSGSGNSGSSDSGSGSGDSGSGSGGSGSSDSGSGSGDSGSSDSESGSGDSGSSDSESNNENADHDKENDGSFYCIVTFSYIEDLEGAQELYQVRSVEEYEVKEGEAAPEDTYSDNSAEEDEELEDAAFSVGSAGVKYAFDYVGPGQGDYKLIRVQETTNKETPDQDKDKENQEEDGQKDGEEDKGTELMGRATSQDSVDAEYVEVRNMTVYMRCCKGNDWLERYVFNSLEHQDNSYDEFGIEVRCVSAEAVEEVDVNDADMIFLEDGLSPYLNTNVKVNYSGAIKSGVIKGMLYDVVTDLKPIIVDYGIIEDKDADHYAEDDTYQKFAKIFLKRDLSTFYDEMDRDGKLVENLLMYMENGSKDYPDKEDNGYNYVNRNVYIINNEELVSEDFAEKFDDDKIKAGFEEVRVAIMMENKIMSNDDRIEEDVSKAMVVQYIINFSVGLIGDYKDLSILELQPTANAESDLHQDAEGKVLFWQKEGTGRAGQQILRSNKEIKTNITVKSVVEFNGEYQDINSQYDMIFIGLDGQNLYRERNKKGELAAVYNNSEELDGKVYHGGDQVAEGDGKYDASDLTLQKKEALLDYLRAGYPIVVENDCFKDKTAMDAQSEVNIDYIARDTRMHEFLEEAIALKIPGESDEDDGKGERAGIYTIEDVHRSAMFIPQLNTVRPVIELVTPEGNEEATDVIETERTPEGDYKGEIVYRISSDRDEKNETYGHDLTKHLYLDMNYDGIFMPDEEVYEYQEESNDGGGRISVNFKEVCFGIVPWKLEISSGKGYRRNAIQGYFTIDGESETTVRVLQVLDDLELTSANIQQQYEEMNNSMLRYYLKRAELLLGMEFKIETVTPAELAGRIEGNGAYLSGWDVVVLGFGDSGHPGDAVVKAVNEYLSKGGSVLMSSAGAEVDKGRLGILPEYLGQSDGSTYGALGIHSGEKYRYKGLSSEMFNKQPGLYTEKINEGTISKWPYQVGNLVSLGENTMVKAPEYLLDIDAGYGEPVTHTTVWYTLNQSGTDTNAYNVSPRDARNNYYIYSKGNIVYIGQSEYPYIYDAISGVRPDTGDKGAGETMLFVNALLAAYNSSVHISDVSIVAGFTSAAEIESVTIPFDVEFKDDDENRGILDETVDVYFKFTDNNIAFDKVRDISFYYEKGNRVENPDPNAPDVTLIRPEGGINNTDFERFESTIWMVENNRLVEVAGEELEQGKVYRIKAPVKALQAGEDETADIHVLLRVKYTRSGQEREMLSEDSIALTRAQMFLLE